jgi:prophage regulatory protein
MTKKTPASPKTLRVLRRPELHAKIGLGDSHIDRLESRGEFPRRIALTDRTMGWLEDEVDEWLRQKIAARDNAAQVTQQCLDEASPAVRHRMREAARRLQEREEAAVRESLTKADLTEAEAGGRAIWTDAIA